MRKFKLVGIDSLLNCHPIVLGKFEWPNDCRSYVVWDYVAYCLTAQLPCIGVSPVRWVPCLSANRLGTGPSTCFWPVTAQIAVGGRGRPPLSCGVVVHLFEKGSVWCTRILEESPFSGSLLLWVLKGLMEVHPASAHVHSGKEKGVWLCSSRQFCVGAEYRVWGPMLRAVRPLYDWRSLVCIVSSKSDLFLVDIGLSLFRDRLSRCSQGSEEIQLWNYMITLSAFCRLRGHAGFTSSPLMCTAVVCSWVWSNWDENEHLQDWGLDSWPENWGLCLWVVGETLPRMEELKFLRALFTSEAKVESEIYRRVGVASAGCGHCTCLEWWRKSKDKRQSLDGLI